jgi:hypothetical protein
MITEVVTPQHAHRSSGGLGGTAVLQYSTTDGTGSSMAAPALALAWPTNLVSLITRCTGCSLGPNLALQ